MDFLNKAFQQVADLFHSMTPAARLTAGLLLAVVVISLAYLVHFQTSASGDYLFGGREFSQAELGTMETAFGQAGLNDFEIDGYKVRVARGQKALYLAALAENNALPRDFTRYLDVALKTSPFESKYVIEQKVKHAKEQILSAMISKMKGIESARVLYETEEKPGLRRSKETRAVVMVNPRSNVPLDQDQIAGIRGTVVAGIGGLKSENVTVTDLGSGASYPGTRNGGVSGVPDSQYAAHKRSHENDYRKQIYDVLRDYPSVVVGVSVELEELLVSEKTSQTYDPQGVAISTNNSSVTSTTTRSESEGGRVGAQPNIGASNQGASLADRQGSESSVEETNDQQRLVSGVTTTKETKPPLLPKRVYASIGVPSSYYAKVWHARNKPVEGEEPKEPDPGELVVIEQDVKKKIEDLVIQLLPKQFEGNDPFRRVSVVTIDQLPPEPIQKPSATETATSWLAGNWQSLGMLFLGMFGLVMLRGMIRAAAAEEPPPREGTPQLQISADTDKGQEEDEAEGSSRLRFGTNGPNLRDELAQLVKEDPEAAASVLKNWIGDAA